MNPWTSQSNPGKQIVASVACAVAGLVLTIGFRGFGSSNARAGFLLGVLLLIVGVAGVLASGGQTVTVDPRARLITVKDSYLSGTRERSIPFGDVVDVSTGYLGKKSSFVTWYYLVLQLRTGEKYSLFSPGRFFQGGSSRSTVESWRQRLQDYVSGGGG
jgi:hypothetical protein